MSSSKDYYMNMESKWVNEYPSPSSIEDVWNFYKECGYKNPQEVILKLLSKVNWANKRVLDYGCDKGLMLNFICEELPEVSGYGLDINHTAIHSAQTQFPTLNFKVFDGYKIPFDDKYFDLVFVCAVIKHIRYEDREHIYRELNRVAKNVFLIEANTTEQKAETMQSWTFYNSNFAVEFESNFTPIEVQHIAGDILGVYECS